MLIASARSVCLAIVVCSGASLPAAAQDSSSCGWSAPRRLEADGGRPVYVEFPSTAVVGGTTLMMGDPTIIWGATDRVYPGHTVKRDSIFPPGIAIDSRGRIHPIPHPFGSFTDEAAPHVVALDDREALVVWGRRDAENGRMDTPVRSIWSARYDGREWHDREKIYEGTVPWDIFTTTNLVRQGSTVSIAAALETLGRTLTLFQRRAGTWSHRELSFDAARAALVSFDGSLVLAYVGRDSAHAGSSTLSVAESHDDGNTWGRPLLLDTRVRSWQADIHLVSLRDRVALLWRVASEQTGGDSVMFSMATRSSDGGLVWARHKGLQFPELARSTSLAADASPDSQEVVVASLSKASSLSLAAWRDGAWQDVRPNLLSGAATPPRFVRLPNAVALEWGTTKDTPAGAEPTSMLVTRAHRCSVR